MRIGRSGFMLASALMLVPICLILTFSLVRLITTNSGFGLQAQQRMKAFYIAEAGLNSGFFIFGLNNFSATTHDSSGSKISASSADALTWPEELDFERDSAGWIRWSYDPQSHPRERSFAQSGHTESYRFKIWFPDPSFPEHWEIECEATIGNRRAVHRMAGVLENPGEFLAFDNGDMVDLARTSNQNLTGRIHANGDLFVAPWETAGFQKNGHYIVAPSQVGGGTQLTALNLDDVDISAGEDLIRRRDYWGRTDSGLLVTLNGISLGTNPGTFYDSESENWNSSGANGALQTFDGRVQTRDIGGRQKSLPHSLALEPGGYFDQRAELRIDQTSQDNGSWLKKVDTYNEAEKQRVRVSEIDIAALHASGEWPSNGLLYAATPIRVTNGAFLPQPLTIVCSETIYLQGDFNKRFHSETDLTSQTERHQPAALMTADRVYRLSEEFVDRTTSEYLFPLADPDLFIHGENPEGSKMRPAQDTPKFPGDPANVLEQNAMVVDSAPTESSAAFAFGDQGHPSVYDPNLKVRLTQDPLSGEVEFVFPSSENFLENLSGIRFEQRGSEVRLRNAKMVSGAYGGMFNEDYWIAPHTSGVREGQGPTPYILRSVYIPPTEYWHSGPESEKPGIFRFHDSRVTGLDDLELPFSLKSARRLFWSAG